MTEDQTYTHTSTDPQSPSPSDILEQLVNILWASLVPAPNPQSASGCSGHPGCQPTLSLLQARYWWPSMSRDVNRYVHSCSVCAMSSTPCHLPVGKLVPLPIPHRPRSHMGIDFMTNLPKSEGHTCILVAVDHFSKACKIYSPPWTANCPRDH